MARCVEITKPGSQDSEDIRGEYGRLLATRRSQCGQPCSIASSDELTGLECERQLFGLAGRGGDAGGDVGGTDGLTFVEQSQ